MTGARSSVPAWLERAALGSLRRPARALGAWLALAVLAGFGLASLEVETSTDSVLDRSGDSWQQYRESVARFGGDEVVVTALRGERPWDPEVLAEVARLTHALESDAAVRRVDSIASIPVIRGTPDGGLRLDPALSGSPPFAPDRVRGALAGDRIAPGLLVSEDGRTFSVTALVPDVTQEADSAVLEAIERAAPRGDFAVSGGPVFRGEVNEQTRSQLALFIPFSGALIALLIGSFVPSVRAVATPLLVGGAASGLVFGVMGALGFPLTLLGVILPSVLLGLGCAYVLHLLVAFAGAEDTPEGRERALQGLLQPVALSGLTTAIGFTAMSVVEIPVVRQLGSFGGLGTLFVTAAALTLAPALLSRGLGARETRFGGWLRQQLPARASRLVREHRRGLVAGWLIAGLAVAVGLSRLDVETDVVLWFPLETPVRSDYEDIRASLSGISPMNVVIESESGRSVTEPDVLAALAGLTAFLERQPEMGRALSLADPLRQLHGGFVADPAEPLPTSRAQAEQYLLLLESVEAVRDLVTGDRQATSVVLRVDHNGSGALVSLARRAEIWWAESGPPDFSAHTTGIMHEYASSEDEIATGQLRGLGLALLVVSLLLRAVAGSRRLAVLALLPNLVPLLLLFATMGLLGVPLDAGTVLLGCLALGIAVDDTIHLITAFRRSLARSATEALSLGFERALPALTLTTIAIAVGFSVLVLSDFTLIRNLGALMGAVMLACYLADVLLLAPLLLFSFRTMGIRGSSS